MQLISWSVPAVLVASLCGEVFAQRHDIVHRSAGHEAIRTLAANAIHKGDEAYLGRPAHFRLCNEGHLHWTPPAFQNCGGDVGSYAMGVRCEIESIWKHLPNAAERKAWEPYLREADAELANILVTASGLEAQDLHTALYESSERVSKIWDMAAHDSARRHRRVLEYEGPHGPSLAAPCGADSIMLTLALSFKSPSVDSIEIIPAGAVWSAHAKNLSEPDFEPLDVGAVKELYIGSLYYYRFAVLDGRGEIRRTKYAPLRVYKSYDDKKVPLVWTGW